MMQMRTGGFPSAAVTRAANLQAWAHTCPAPPPHPH